MTDPVPPIRPMILEGRHVRLKPLSLAHVKPLLDVARGPRETSAYTWVPGDEQAAADVQRTAILRLGARLDGVLRGHTVGADGTVRDSAVYSIVEAEWPAVKAALQARWRRSAS